MGLKWGQDINLWAGGESAGGIQALRADLSKGREMRWEAETVKKGTQESGLAGVWLRIVYPREH